MLICLAPPRHTSRWHLASIALAALWLTGCATGSKATAVTCPQPATLKLSEVPRTLEVLRVYTGADGDSKLEVIQQPGVFKPLFNTDKQIGLFDLGAAKKVSIVVGPADLELPLHPAPYREAFLTVSGSVQMKLADGESRLLVPGSFVIFEDTDATHGHGGHTGPCGYVAVSVTPPDGPMPWDKR